MAPPEPPHRAPPGGLIEVNAARGPHTPVPPAEAHASPTAPPPAPDRRPPPRGLSGPRTHMRHGDLLEPVDESTLTGLGEPANIRDSREISTDTLLDELARKGNEARAAEAEAAELRAKVAVLERARPSERPPTPNAWKGQLFKLVAALTALIGALAVALEAYTAQLRLKLDNVDAKVTAQEVVTKPLPAQAAVAATDADRCRDWARAYDDYERQIWARFGVAIPRQPNALPSTTVEFTAAKARPNRVTGGIILEVRTPPPPLP